MANKNQDLVQAILAGRIAVPLYVVSLLGTLVGRSGHFVSTAGPKYILRHSAGQERRVAVRLTADITLIEDGMRFSAHHAPSLTWSGIARASKNVRIDHDARIVFGRVGAEPCDHATVSAAASMVGAELLCATDADILCGIPAAKIHDIIIRHCNVMYKGPAVKDDDLIHLFPYEFPRVDVVTVRKNVMKALGACIPEGGTLQLPRVRPMVALFMWDLVDPAGTYTLPTDEADVDNLLALFSELGISLRPPSAD